MFQKNVIVSFARTAVGSFGGSLKDFSAIDLGAIAIREAVRRAGIDPSAVDEVVFGCVGQYGLNSFLSRMASLKAGIPESASAQTVNRMCASGLQAIVTGAQMIELGDADMVVAGGAESMSNYPYTLQGARYGMRMGVAENALLDALTVALCEPTTGVRTHIAITAENMAAKFGLTRRDLDEYALESQIRARKAIDEGRFRGQIVPVEVLSKKERFAFDTDEHPRDTSMEKLAKLRPIVKPDGLVTAGNASGVNDAGAALVMMSAERAKALSLAPIARVVDFACAGVDPMYMGLGPIEATKKLMQKSGLSLDQMRVIELNEAFASQALAGIRGLGLSMDRVNPNGSGISLGHPIGATGAIISIKLIEEMRRIDARYGLATLCIGGGQGMSAIFERL